MAGNKKKVHDIALLNTLPIEQITNMFEAGMSETRICVALGVSKKALTEWLDAPEQEGFLVRVRARAANHIVGEMIEIADETDIEEINKAGTTILLVEQNASMALSVADRAYVLETGEIVLAGKASELRENPKVREAYLGEEAG